MSALEIKEIVASLIEKLNSCGSEYCFLRNYEELPDSWGTDLDILVDEQYLIEVDAIISELCSKYRGYVYLHQSKKYFKQFKIIFPAIIGRNTIQLDFFSAITCKGIPYLTAGGILNSRILYKELFYSPSPVYEAIISLLHPLVGSGLVKEKYRHDIMKQIIDNHQEFGSHLSRILSKDISNLLIGYYSNGEIESIKKLRNRIILKVWSNQIKSDFTRFSMDLTATIWNEFKHPVKRLQYFRGIHVVFLGPDGCGKSTVVKSVIDKLSPAYIGISSIHLRYRPLRWLRSNQDIDVSNPQAQSPRSRSMSIIKIIYLLLIYWLGHLTIVRPQSWRSRLVVFDRYFQDFLVDPIRFRYGGPSWLIEFAAKLIPYPDLWIFLDAPAEVLQSRKREVTIDETRRQRDEYLRLATSLSNCHIVDASMPLEVVIEETSSLILSYSSRYVMNELR